MSHAAPAPLDDDLPPLSGGLTDDQVNALIKDDSGRAIARFVNSLGQILALLELIEREEAEITEICKTIPFDECEKRLVIARVGPDVRKRFFKPLEATPAYGRLQDYCDRAAKSEPTAGLVRAVIGQVRSLTKLPRADVLSMSLSEAMDVIENGAPATPFFDQLPALQPEAHVKIPNSLTSGGKALAAAYELRHEGKGVSVNAACNRAKVDRKNLSKRHPDIVRMIKALAAPDCSPPKMTRDRRTGNVDAIDEDDE